jgi:hypothetical protein
VNLTRENWPLGWTPSADANNGDVRGLLRADNLHLDDEGVLSLGRGIRKLNSTPFSAHVVDLFSYQIDVSDHVYAGLQNGTVIKSSNSFSSQTEILTGGANRTAFGAALGQILICSGTQRKKDNGTTVRNLGIQKPTGPPVVVAAPRSWLELVPSNSWTAEEGSGATSGTSYQLNLSANFRASAYHDATSLDTTFTSTGTAEKPEDDTFHIGVRIGNTKDLRSVSVEFLLNDPTGEVTDYYHYTWEYGIDSQFRDGISTWSNLSARRGDFKREGEAAGDWQAIRAIRVVMVFNEDAVSANNLFNDLRFVGGARGVLSGLYDYVQVNVYNSGNYIGKSEMGPIAESNWTNDGYFNVAPQQPVDSQVNEIWIFRRARTPENFNPEFDKVGLLDKFYRVQVLVPVGGVFSAVDDFTSDEQALADNITLNEYLTGLQDVGEIIYGIEGIYYDRMLYLTINSLLLSDRLNPDSIDERYSIKVSGNPSEKYLWVTKVTNGVLLLATTRDIYEISGDLSELPDGSLNINVRALGEAHPPISEDFAKSKGLIFYCAGDGWRATAGTNSESIAHELRHLFNGEVRHNFQAVALLGSNNAVYACSVAHNKLYTCVPLTDGTRWTMVYDIVKKYWHIRKTDPFVFYTKQDGTLLAGYGGGSGNYIRQFDVGTTIDDSGGQEIYLRTVFDHNGQPRNRKDSFTFKINLDTGGVDVTVAIATNGSGVYTSLGTINSNGKGERLITIAETIGLTKSYSLLIQGSGLTRFKLYNFTIEYDPRPEQLTYLRIPYTNLGTQSRKRFFNFPIVIDTLGTDCTIQPLIDGETAGPPSNFNLDRKGTYHHHLVPDTSGDDDFVGYDIGAIICGFFEFYGTLENEAISEKLPAPTKYLYLHNNDYGVPNRKRHSSYKFSINTRGGNVRFTPRLDGVWQTPSTHNTTEKRIVEHFFTADTIAIDIGGRLETLSGTPFEFYGTITPQKIEVLADRLREFRIPENNYGIAAKKRIRTMPMEINTNGQNVTFTPIVDGVSLSTTTLNSATRGTVFHYFATDVFGTDFSGELVAVTDTPFEFYGLLKPEGVEVLPVAKRFDQIGPIRFDKLGTLFALRIRGIFGERDIPVKIINEVEATLPNSSSSVGEYSVTLKATANKDDVYELSLPKTVNGTIFRIEIGPTTNPFHRYDVQLKTHISGMDADPKWVNVR